MYKSSPKSIGAVLETLFTELGLRERYKRSEVIASWEEIVGEQIARVATAERVVGKRLFVHVSDGSWRNELHFRKKEIITKINRHVGMKAIEDIMFH
jgi:predicted nucleic acid-binding Zn ribbon protein